MHFKIGVGRGNAIIVACGAGNFGPNDYTTDRTAVNCEECLTAS